MVFLSVASKTPQPARGGEKTSLVPTVVKAASLARAEQYAFADDDLFQLEDDDDDDVRRHAPSLLLDVAAQQRRQRVDVDIKLENEKRRPFCASRVKRLWVGGFLREDTKDV